MLHSSLHVVSSSNKYVVLTFSSTKHSHNCAQSPLSHSQVDLKHCSSQIPSPQWYAVHPILSAKRPHGSKHGVN